MHPFKYKPAVQLEHEKITFFHASNWCLKSHRLYPVGDAAAADHVRIKSPGGLDRGLIAECDTALSHLDIGQSKV